MIVRMRISHMTTKGSLVVLPEVTARNYIEMGIAEEVPIAEVKAAIDYAAVESACVNPAPPPRPAMTNRKKGRR